MSNKQIILTYIGCEMLKTAVFGASMFDFAVGLVFSACFAVEHYFQTKPKQIPPQNNEVIDELKKELDGVKTKLTALFIKK